MRVVREHPNATAAAGSGGFATGMIALLAALGITIPPVAAAAIATAVPVVFLAVGRKGIRGIVRQVWRGSEDENPA